MLGAAKAILAQTVIPSPYSCFITPSFIQSRSGNGSNTSSSATASVVSGVGPFTYQWTIDNNKITILNDDTASTAFRASGYNGEVEGVATVTVTDTGNGNAETTAQVGVLFLFGTLN